MRDYFVVLLVMALSSFFSASGWAQKPSPPPQPPEPVLHADRSMQGNITVNVNENNGERETHVEMTDRDGAIQSWKWKGTEIPAHIREDMEHAGLDVSSLEQPGANTVTISSKKNTSMEMDGTDNVDEIHVVKEDATTTVSILYKDGGRAEYDWEGSMPESIGSLLQDIDPQLHQNLRESADHNGVSLEAELMIEIEEAKVGAEVHGKSTTKVGKVKAGGAASEAGLQTGDIIDQADGEKLTANRTISDILGEKSVGDTITLTISRDGEIKEITVKLAKK